MNSQNLSTAATFGLEERVPVLKGGQLRGGRGVTCHLFFSEDIMITFLYFKGAQSRYFELF